MFLEETERNSIASCNNVNNKKSMKIIPEKIQTTDSVHFHSGVFLVTDEVLLKDSCTWPV